MIKVISSTMKQFPLPHMTSRADKEKLYNCEKLFFEFDQINSCRCLMIPIQLPKYVISSDNPRVWQKRVFRDKEVFFFTKCFFPFCKIAVPNFV